MRKFHRVQPKKKSTIGSDTEKNSKCSAMLYLQNKRRSKDHIVEFYLILLYDRKE